MQLPDMEKKVLLEKEIMTRRSCFETWFERLLAKVTSDMEIKDPKRLSDSAIDYLLKVMCDIVYPLLITLQGSSVYEFKNEFSQIKLGEYSPLKPSDEELDVLEGVVNKNNKKQKQQYFFGPYEEIQLKLKEINNHIKPNVALFIYGIAEKMVYKILYHVVFYETQSEGKEAELGPEIIKIVLQLYYTLSNNSEQVNSPVSNMSSDYDECTDHLRSFLQMSYDQCNIILRILPDPSILQYDPQHQMTDSVMSNESNGSSFHASENKVLRIINFINTFMNIYRATLESIEDMNDHVSSGGSSRTGADQRLMGYCLESSTDDFKVYNFYDYIEYILDTNFNIELIQILERPDVRKFLLDRGCPMINTSVSKYANSRDHNWPQLHHRGCEHCCGLGPLSNGIVGYEPPIYPNVCTLVQNFSIQSSQISINTLATDMTYVSSNFVSTPNNSTQSYNSDGRLKSGECNYLINCFVYLLPRLLFQPIFQFFYLAELIENFRRISTNEQDVRYLTDISSDYRNERKRMEKILRYTNQIQLKEIYDRMRLLHMNEFQPTLFQFDQIKETVSDKLPDSVIRNYPDLQSYLKSHYITQTYMCQLNENKKWVNRHVYLFDNVLLIFKEDTSWKQNSTNYEKLKKIVSLNCIHVIDLGCITNINYGSILEVTPEQYSSSLISLNSPSSYLKDDQYVSVDIKPKNCQYFAFSMYYQETKNNGSYSTSILYFATDKLDVKMDWMASLLHIQTNKLFKIYIRDLPRQEIPLRLPDPKKYKFVEPDTPDNIQFEACDDDMRNLSQMSDYEDDNSDDMDMNDYPYKGMKDSGHPQIRYATKHKLIEHLTLHTYHDFRALHMFMLAYRRFMTSEELLDLLIERFNIPPPDFTHEEETRENESGQSLADQMLKRFKSSYERRVQRRVVWVILRWIDNPSFFRYDFAGNPGLCETLLRFINSIKYKELQNACRQIRDRCQNLESGTLSADYHDQSQMPNDSNLPMVIHIGLTTSPFEITIHNVHPVELARQITLHEWDLYHRILYWEVEGKETQTRPTPNLTKSKEFSNRIRNWFVYSILTEEHFEDRVCALLRVTDIMILCEYWHNFQGSQEARSALISASVFRLKKMFSHVIRRYRSYKTVLTKLRKVAEVGKSKKPTLYSEYEENIRKIEESKPPIPCVPFIALGTTTKLIHGEIGNPDFVKSENGVTLINFRKHILLSQIIERYFSFQRLPYRFKRHEDIARFLETIDPLGKVDAKDEDDFERIMFEKSEKYESRDPESSVNLDQDKERRLSRVEQKLAENLNGCSVKDKLDPHKQNTLKTTVSNLCLQQNVGSPFSISSSSTSKSGPSELSSATNYSAEPRSSPPERPPRNRQDILRHSLSHHHSQTCFSFSGSPGPIISSCEQTSPTSVNNNNNNRFSVHPQPPPPPPPPPFPSYSQQQQPIQRVESGFSSSSTSTPTSAYSNSFNPQPPPVPPRPNQRSSQLWQQHPVVDDLLMPPPRPERKLLR